MLHVLRVLRVPHGRVCLCVQEVPLDIRVLDTAGCIPHVWWLCNISMCPNHGLAFVADEEASKQADKHGSKQARGHKHQVATFVMMQMASLGMNHHSARGMIA